MKPFPHPGHIPNTSTLSAPPHAWYTPIAHGARALAIELLPPQGHTQNGAAKHVHTQQVLHTKLLKMKSICVPTGISRACQHMPTYPTFRTRCHTKFAHHVFPKSLVPASQIPTALLGDAAEARLCCLGGHAGHRLLLLGGLRQLGADAREVLVHEEHVA